MNERGSQIDNTYFSLAFRMRSWGQPSGLGCPASLVWERRRLWTRRSICLRRSRAPTLRIHPRLVFRPGDVEPISLRFEAGTDRRCAARNGQEDGDAAVWIVWDSVTYAARQGASPPDTPASAG